MAQQFLYAPEAARGKDGGLGGVVHGVVFPSMLTLLRIDGSRRYVRAMPSSIRSAEGVITKVPRRSGRRIGIVLRAGSGGGPRWSAFPLSSGHDGFHSATI